MCSSKDLQPVQDSWVLTEQSHYSTAKIKEPGAKECQGLENLQEEAVAPEELEGPCNFIATP